MNILFIGDIVGPPGCNMVRRTLPKLKRRYDISLVVANGENASAGNGILPKTADFLFHSGVDVLTLGNHAFRRREIYDYLDEQPYIIRPFNYPKGVHGRGFCIYDMGAVQIAVVNLIGQVYLSPNGDPFEAADCVLKQIDTPNILVDFHAEATGEKGAMAYYLAGRVSAVLGTHTHVQTADARILKERTGFVSDVGMTGPYDSILGACPSAVVQGLTTHLPTRFRVEDGPCHMQMALLQLETKTGVCQEITALQMMD